MPFTLAASFPIDFGLVASDHSEAGDSLLAAQYKDPGPRMRAWLASYLASHDIADAVLYDVENYVINVTEAVGAQLDILGKIVGESRGTQTDDEYRLAIAVRILINRSNGTLPEVLLIAQTYERATEDANQYVHIYDTPPAAIEIEIAADPIHSGLEVHKRMRQSVAAGVGVWTIVTPEGDGSTLVYGQGDEPTTAPLEGLGWSGDATLGGAAAWVQGN
jgi:hypothetical protein